MRLVARYRGQLQEPNGGLAYEKPQSGYAPLPQAQVCGFSPAHFVRR
jgi:hypothetical protein